VPRVLLLSTTTGYQLRSFGDAARELGVELMFATDRCHTLDDPWRDGAVAVRFHEQDDSLAAILGAARSRPIDGVLALGDRPVVLAARVTSALGLRGNTLDAATASAQKRLARERFASAGMLVPVFTAASVGDDISRIASSVAYPVVIKPVGLSGSRGVIRADTARELTDAFRRVAALLARPDIRAQRTGTERDLLIEEFIPGDEYAIEGLLTAGVFRPLAIFDKPEPLNGPFFEETIYITPSRSSLAVQSEIVRTVQRAATALGLTHGPIHAECRVNSRGVFILEVAARPIGGLCSRVLRFAEKKSGPERGQGKGHRARLLSLEHLLLRHALGEDVLRIRREESAAAVMMIPIPRRGVFKAVTGVDDARRLPCVEDVQITAKVDQRLEPLPEAGSYVGFIFARAPLTAQAESAVRDAHRRLAFTIDTAIDLRTNP
jgi:ATP-grasp domain/L-amino acid ligase C-terminal domain 2/ATP-grasp N-terminal domain